MNKVLSCPIDQLHVGGYLACEVSDLALRDKLSDIRYITAKRLKSCDVTEFNNVSGKFHLQKDLVYQVVRGSTLPPSPQIWLPAFCDSLDTAAIYWGIKFDEDDCDWTHGFDEWGVGVIPHPEFDGMESLPINPRRSVRENV